jgi:hypothetical protein
MTELRTATAPDLKRPGLLMATKVVAVLYAALVLVQAVLAGRGWFKDFDLIDTHGQIGQGLFLVAVVQAALAFLVFGARSWLSIASAALLVLTAIQLSLGMASEDSSTAASLHIPNGVLIFGLATVFATSVVRVADSR